MCLRRPPATQAKGRRCRPAASSPCLLHLRRMRIFHNTGIPNVNGMRKDVVDALLWQHRLGVLCGSVPPLHHAHAQFEYDARRHRDGDSTCRNGNMKDILEPETDPIITGGFFLLTKTHRAVSKFALGNGLLCSFVLCCRMHQLSFIITGTLFVPMCYLLVLLLSLFQFFVNRFPFDLLANHLGYPPFAVIHHLCSIPVTVKA